MSIKRANQIIQARRLNFGFTTKNMEHLCRMDLSRYCNIEECADSFIDILAMKEARMICKVLGLEFIKTVASELDDDILMFSEFDMLYVRTDKRDLISKKRESFGLSTAQLSSLIGCSSDVISKVESNSETLECMPIALSIAISKALDLPLIFFLQTNKKQSVSVNQIIKKQRLALGLTDMYMAKYCGLNVNCYADIESYANEFIDNVSLCSAQKICECLGLDFMLLLGVAFDINAYPDNSSANASIPRNLLISNRRKELGLSHIQIADMVGLQHDAISDLEADINYIDRLPARFIFDIANALNLLPALLLSDHSYCGRTSDQQA